GLRVRRATYFNSLLFPLLYLWRRTAGRVLAGSGDLWQPPAVLNGPASLLFGLERVMLRHADLPFGGSAAVIAEKPRPARAKRPGISAFFPVYNDAATVGSLILEADRSLRELTD